jgi:hypothetical protein
MKPEASRTRPCARRSRSELGAQFGLVALLALGAAACDPDFDPGSNVNSLRVLAVQADNPYAAPGETVRLQALSYDPEARPITWAWAFCARPASSSVDSCLADIAQTTATTGALPLLGMGEGLDSIEVTIPADTLDSIPPEARANTLVGVLSVACPGNLELNAELDPGGADNPLPFRCTDSAGAQLDLHDSIVSVKRIFMRQTDRNQNPIITQVTFDGADWPEDYVPEVSSCSIDDFTYDDCDGADKHRLAAVVAPESFETGTDEFGRNFTEELIVQHFATEGIFEYEVRIAADPETGWVARRQASGGEITVWFVARDDRGGVSYTARQVRVL